MYVYFTFKDKDISAPILFNTLEEAQEKMKSDFVLEAHKNNRLINLDQDSVEDSVDETEETDVSENNEEEGVPEEDTGNIEEKKILNWGLVIGNILIKKNMKSF